MLLNQMYCMCCCSSEVGLKDLLRSFFIIIMTEATVYLCDTYEIGEEEEMKVSRSRVHVCE